MRTFADGVTICSSSLLVFLVEDGLTSSLTDTGVGIVYVPGLGQTSRVVPARHGVLVVKERKEGKDGFFDVTMISLLMMTNDGEHATYRKTALKTTAMDEIQMEKCIFAAD